MLILILNLEGFVNVKMQVLAYNLPKQIKQGDFFLWGPRLGESMLTYIVLDTPNLA